MESKGENNKSTRSAKSSGMFRDDDIVISGIAGRFPDSDNMRHFQENLFNKVDLVSDDDRRWKLDHPEIPQRTGKINNVGKFDSLFFGVHFKQAHTMDPMCRMLLEHAYEAIVDAGVNPRELRGTKTGVFIGACFSESEKTWFYEKLQVNGFGITGCSRAMLANRISYWLGVNGPSYTVDSACSSSLFAMEHAYRAIRSGQCEAALVGGANLCLHPYVSLQFSRLGVLAPDGRCKSFDADANGYTRSEAVSLLYLQKAKNAKRIYATYVHGKTNCDGFKEQGITFPSSVMQSALLKEFYEECGIPPTSLAYVEAHGTGTKVGDPEEVNALERVFCTGRKTPLKIGSIKSNLGHAEPASGMCSMAKIVIAMESGLIPPNLHYKHPREGVKALEDGRIKVITDPTPWEGGYVGINSFGFGGANAHVLLKSNTKEKVNNGAPDDDLPRLVVTSGRTEEAVDSILRDVESRPVDVEYVRLLQDIHSDDIPGHMYRGYTIVGGSATGEKSLREIQPYPGAKRPVWFVFSGMGSQWPGMGTALLRFPVFAAAIQKCDAVLKPRGVDIYDILTNMNKSTFDNILNSFVGIAAIQIGLVDLLTHIGIVPDKIIGHSVGELGCSYADGCFTAEQMILSAYSRGLASIETDMIRGSMAAIGLGYEDIKGHCPPDIEVACHNGPDSSTISGPAESMKAFVAKLQAKNIFAREVPCSNIAYHSRYIAKAGPKLLAYLQRVIPEPKPRSPKWVSTSVPRSEWGTAQARLSSAEYHTNNLLSAVLFEETSTLIPKDAITIEIAPHGLLQAILRRSLNPNVSNVSLTQRGHRDNVEVFLQAIGKLFNVGLQPEISKLFPDIEYPVSRGTPMISPLIKWEHRDDWYVTSYRMQEKITSGERTVEVLLSDEDYEYMGGHVVDGRNLLPATGYLALVWETVGMMSGELYTEISVVFEDVKFLRATTIPKEGAVELTLMVQKGTGRFEVIEGGAAVVTGRIHPTANASHETMNMVPPSDDKEIVQAMSSRDIYKELRLRGYQYAGLFQGLKSASIDARKGTIAWANNWVAFMDNMLQMHLLASDTRGLFIPTGIQKLTIDTKKHLNMIREMTSEEKEFPVRFYKDHEAIVSGGVEIRGLKASAISRRKPVGEPVLETYGFIAHRDNAETSLADFVRLSGNLAFENHHSIQFKTIEAIAEETAPDREDLASTYLLEVLGDLPLIQADVNVVAPSNPYEEGKLPQTINFVESKKLTTDTAAIIACGRNLFTSSKIDALMQLLLALRDGGFLLTRETADSPDIYEAIAKRGLNVILEKRNKGETLLLLRKRGKLSKRTTVINVRSNEFGWLAELKSAVKTELESTVGGTGRIILVSEKDFENGVYALVNCLRKERGGETIRGYVIQDENAQDFSEEDPLYANQLRLDLAVNVLRAGGVWGTYRHLKLPEYVEKPVYHGWANQSVRGDLGSLRWLEGPIRPTMDHRKLARVVYSSINFRDVMLATGKLAVEVVAKNRHTQECPYGLEFSAVTSSGDRIMGLVETRGFANIIEIDENLSWKVPDDWSMEDAATVPCVYATCYYALCYNGKMKRGDRILVHAGSGGVGQAAIALALHEGCEVFTTVGTPEKRNFIRNRFPQIAEDHIGDSRSTSFEQMITRQTKGRGVDIVLNSLAEEKLQASLRCLATGGRFLEIGKFDLAANNPLGMEIFLREISFYGVMLDNLLIAPPERKAELQKLLQSGLDSGAVKPLTRTVFPREQLEAAFRYMAAGKHIGKVLIRIHPEKEKLESPVKGLPRFYCQRDRSYVIHGGLGGFGLELADWLVLRGAQNLVLTSRSGIRNGYQLKRIELWKSYGVRVLVVVGRDLSEPSDCEDLLKTSAKLAPVGAIFNLAAVLNDHLLVNQTEAMFEESFRAKAWSTKVLDEISRKLCPQLEHFVVFSSVVSGRGNAGQTNYGMANNVMERICERRANEGLPGLAIQWGAIGDVGLVANLYDNHEEIVIGGTLQQRISSCLAQMDKLLKQDSPIVGSMVIAEKRVGGAGALSLVDTVLNIMALKDLKSVSTHRSLAELGMDSMMAVEIKQTLEREFEIFLTAQDIRSLNFEKLIEMSARNAEEKKRTGKTTGGDEPLTGMKLLVHILGDRELEREVCLKLVTKEEVGRDEVFLVPGIEGYGSIFHNLAAKLRSPATCLQMIHSKNEAPTISRIAEQFLPYVLERNKNRRDFVIAGYSFGSLVAIELARRLEAEGLTGRLVLIDGAPELMKAIKNQQLSSSSEDELQTNVLLGIMDMLSPATSSEFLVALEKCKTWTEKLDAFMSRAPTQDFKISPEDQRNLCTGILNRLLALEKYDHTKLPLLRSSIILLKPTCPTLKSMSPSYSLNTVTRENVEVFTVEGNHVSILDSPKIAAAINGEPLEDADAFKARIMEDGKILAPITDPQHWRECQASWDEWWTYDGISGPSFWGLINPQWSLCTKGRRQSPINIEPDKLLYDPHLRPVNIDKHHISGHLQNTGQFLIFKVDKDSKPVNITDGPLAYRYQFEEIYIHYGMNNTHGSEHRINNYAFPAEIQIYGFNAQLYHNMSEAQHKSQGLVAISVMVQVGDTLNSELRAITSVFNNVQYRSGTASVRNISLKHLLPKTEDYMTYEGSTTHPGCWETAIWLILNKPIYITAKELYVLRRLMQGPPTTPKAPLGNNARPLQGLHHRTVRTNLDFRKQENVNCPSMKQHTYYRANTWSEDNFRSHEAV